MTLSVTEPRGSHLSSANGVREHGAVLPMSYLRTSSAPWSLDLPCGTDAVK